MMNLAMKEALEKKEAVDLNKVAVALSGGALDGCWRLERLHGDVDYCDPSTERWVGSIGRHNISGELHAAPDARFYQHPDYECVWLR